MNLTHSVIQKVLVIKKLNEICNTACEIVNNENGATKILEISQHDIKNVRLGTQVL